MSGRAAALELSLAPSSSARPGPTPAITSTPDGASYLPRASDESNDGGTGLRRYLLSEWKSGTLKTKQVCVTSYWAARSGSIGVADLALHPDSTHFA
eukprot:5743987-Pyramimonas_sp.AAC.1